MKGAYNLTQDPITPTLMKLSVPIIATNFIQTTYGMVDMIWVGRLGSGPVAAIGTASFFVNLAGALFTLVSIGTGIKVAQSIGANQESETRQYIKNGFWMAILLAIIYTAFILLFNKRLIGFFDLGAEVEGMAVQFLILSMIGVIFTFFNMLYSMVLNSMGDSRTPFRINTIGFVINIILDPFLIFGIGNIGGLGVMGAALATIVANLSVTLMFYYGSRGNFAVFSKDIKMNHSKIAEVIRMGLPITVQRVTFTIISIIIAKIIVEWGPNAIAVQKVGIQIESISYMTIGGLQGAIAAFVGQNYGAGKMDRIHTGYRTALWITIVFGIGTSLLFILFPKQLFSIFITEKESIELGADYMRIIGFSQVFMCMEILTVGAFNGIGKTYIPPMFSITLTALRIPMAIILSGPFGLNGVWLSIAVSSFLKGVVLVIWFFITLKRMEKHKKLAY